MGAGWGGGEEVGFVVNLSTTFIHPLSASLQMLQFIETHSFHKSKVIHESTIRTLEGYMSLRE